MFKFTTVTVTPRAKPSSQEVGLDGRPLGTAVLGSYGWVAVDLDGNIVDHQLDTREDAARALLGGRSGYSDEYAKSKADPHDEAWGYDR